MVSEPAGVPGTGDGMVSGRARTFRVFVSSTFADFVTERDVLRERVWPRLRAYCAAHGARFQEVDLRWGVSEEAALDQQTMNICLREVERCHDVTPRPNFLILVGDRSGWMPPPPQIPAAEWDLIKPRLNKSDQDFVADWYVRDNNAVPAEYRLRARTGNYIDREVWEPEEARLQKALASAVTSLPLSGSRKRAYLRSATDQEIALGALGAHRPGQVVCFTRTITGHPTVAVSSPKAAVRTFVDPDTTYLGQLKEALKERFGQSQVIEETVPWGVDAPNLDQAYLVRFADGVYAALKAAIDEELTNPWPRPAEPGSDDPGLDVEGGLHRGFGEKKVEFFTGRTQELAVIRTYLHGKEPRPLVVHGEGGTGKSALMAAVAREALHDQPDAVIITRFIGATPSSSDGRALLASICAELARRCGEAESQVPSDYAELVTDFASRLSKATAQKPIIVVIDSLDQLDPGPARSLAWIPPQLPDHARLVVSTRRGDTLTPLQRRAGLLEVSGLPTADGEQLLKAWLDNARRALQPEQCRQVLDVFGQSGGNPLYLQLAFEEARRWVSADGKPPETLAAGVEPLIRQNLFRRLEQEDQHGKMLVTHALGYIAASRYGLAEDELVDLLSRDPDVYRWFLARAFHLPPDLLALDPVRKIALLHEKPEERRRMQADPAVQAELEAFLSAVLPRPDGPRLPAVVWSRLLADLDPYLTLRRAEGGDLLAFHHRELTDVAWNVYAAGEPGRVLHSRLADYFQAKADPHEDRSWTTGTDRADVRGLSELPHHLTGAERWDDLTKTLTDFGFLEQKCAKVGVNVQGHGPDSQHAYSGVFQLQADFENALQHLPGGAGGPSRNLPVIVTAVDLGQGLVVRCPHCNTSHPFREEWQDHRIFCPNPDCGKPLKINPFTVAQWAEGGLTHGHGSPLGALLSESTQRCPVNNTKQVSGCGPRSIAKEPLSSGIPPCPRAHGRGVLSALHRILALESHRFAAGSGPVNRAGYVTQQLCLQALASNAQELVKLATTRLIALPLPQLIPCWTTARTSPALERTFDRPSECVAVTPDGGRLVTCVNDEYAKAIQVLDLTNGAPVGKRISLGYNQAHLMAVTPDGTRIVTAHTYSDETIRVWDMETGELLGEHLSVRRVGHVTSLAITPDGTRIVTAHSSENKIRIWDVQTGELLGEHFTGHKGWGEGGLTSFAITPDGTRVVSGGEDGTIRIWDLETGEPLGEPLTGYRTGYRTRKIASLAITPDGTRIVCGSAGETIRIWDLQTGQLLVEILLSPSDTLHIVAVSPDGTRIVSGHTAYSIGGSSLYSTIRVWDLETGAPIGKPLRGHDQPLGYMAFTPDGARIISHAHDGIRVWDLDSVEEVAELVNVHTEGIVSLAVTPDVTRIVSASHDKTIRIWDMETGCQVGQPLEGHTDGIKAAVVTPDGSRIVSESFDGTMRLWDVNTGTQLGDPIPTHGHSLAITPDGTCIIIGAGHGVMGSPKGGIGTAQVWDLGTRAPLTEPVQGHTSFVGSVAVTPDGTRFVTGSGDHTLRIWDLRTCTPISEPLIGHGNPVRSVVVTPDGERIISGAQDKTLRVWDLRTGAPIGKPLSGHSSTELSVAVTPDGDSIVSGSSDSTIRVWDLRTGRNITEVALPSPIQAITVAAVSGSCAVIGGDKLGALFRFTLTDPRE